MKQKRHKGSEAPAKQADKAPPLSASEAACLAGLTAQAQGRLAEAAAMLRSCVESDHRNVEAWLGLGGVLRDQNALDEAERAYRAALCLRPGLAVAFGGLAELCLRQGRFDLALDHGRKAIFLSRPQPDVAFYVTVGRALNETQRHDEALQLLATALQLAPDNPDVHFEMGLVYEEQGKYLAAFDAYQKTIQHRPRDVRVYNNMASILVKLGQYALATSTARMATALAPNHPDVYLNLATALRLSGASAEAASVYEKIVSLNPDHGEALVELVHRRQHLCAWDGLDALKEHAWRNSIDKDVLVSPFIVMTATDRAEQQLRCARVWGQKLARQAGAPLSTYRPNHAAHASAKIRLGYLSADFHSHATAMLIVEMLEQHDRGRFELFAYSLGPDDGSVMRQRLVWAFDHFRDLRPLSDQDAARQIHADGIDILLDLKGYTQDARVKILAHRPAPVQINYLGFPGTMGAPFIDYIVADAQIAPFDHAAHFDEKIVHLPHCYQPNDRRRPYGAGALTRADVGLPPRGFVFCSFNNPYKITSAIFDIWMRLLRKAPGSVLWLLAPKADVAARLSQEAAARGIDPTRLVFAPFVSPDQHMARLSLADLFLDTLPVNAHTTASEALWAGVPLVTCTGETFTSRVAASLVHAAGVPELATTSLAAYEALADRIAREPRKLRRLRRRLQDNRLSSPLFDTPRYTRNFEKALVEIDRLRQAGEAPRAFAVTDDV